MLDQAIDFRDESEALFKLLEPMDDGVWSRNTQFKSWTVNDVLSHLHFWNFAADLSFTDEPAFMTLMADFQTALEQGQGHMDFSNAWLDGTKDRELLIQWRDFYMAMADRFVEADPRMRLKWVGPDMSVRSSISARLMETWAHGQEVYDVLGQACVHTDRVKNIAVMGINTFGWTFVNRGLDVPPDVPYLRLTAPSGEVWEWNEPSEDNRVEGSAAEFCQVVTQVRNVGDTSLKTRGATAQRWMSIAQCFAGGPEDPPATGSRFTKS